MKIEKGVVLEMSGRIYYARSMQLYGSDKEKEQLIKLRVMGEVLNPMEFSEDKFVDKVAVFKCETCGKNRYYSYVSDKRKVDCEQCGVVMIRKSVVLKYLLGILTCKSLVFTDNDGYISRGVYNEIMFAEENGVKAVWFRDNEFVYNWDLRFYDVKDWKYKYAVINEV